MWYLLTLRSLSRLLFLLAELQDSRVFLPTEDESRAPAALCADRSRQQMINPNRPERVLELQYAIDLTWSGSRCSSEQSVREQLQAQVLLDGPALLVGEPISLCRPDGKFALGVRSHDDRSGCGENWGKRLIYSEERELLLKAFSLYCSVVSLLCSPRLHLFGQKIVLQ